MTGLRPNGPPGPLTSGAGTIAVGGRTYAVGLLWALPKDPRRPAGSAHELARSLGATLCCVRASGRPQIGCARAGVAGHAGGQPVAATALADALSGTWAAVWPVGDRQFWLVAVDGDAIVTDNLHDTEEAARDALLEIAVRVPKVFAPAECRHWVAGAEEAPAPLERLLRGRIVWRLQRPPAGRDEWLRRAGGRRPCC